ncbi:MAG: DnaJ domain-containing protein [Alphaproteobacteria bacterium]|nr:DnaJ domain-containing protein [Alphaproteobacteria bacterium]
MTPRFGPGHLPTTADVAAVLELSVLELRDEDRVKTRYRELARRFHPDRTANDPGPTSRFVELQQAFEAWKSGLPGAS